MTIVGEHREEAQRQAARRMLAALKDILVDARPNYTVDCECKYCDARTKSARIAIAAAEAAGITAEPAK